MADVNEASGRRGAYARTAARKQEILDRAIEVFARRGTNRTSLRAIADAVGVTHGTLTHHFGTLEELLVAVYEESDRVLAERVGSLGADPSPVEIIAAYARANREVPGLVQLYSALMAAGIQDDHPVATAFATQWFATLRARLADYIRAQQQSGRVRDDVDPTALAALVIAASDGLQTQWLLDDDAPQTEALAILERLLQPGTNLTKKSRP